MYDTKKIIEEKKDDYRRNPKLILADYNKEEAEIKGYHGRELLELLQNAVDEIESANDKSVCIEFIGNTLKFSNNGKEFSEDGFTSLLYANLSPKHNKPNYIGDKGTGFRSVLNWSNRIRIYSGGLSVEFGPDHAVELLDELLKIPAVSDYKDKYPELNVATLTAPKNIDALAGKEFDTIIELHIKNDDMADNVRKQIDELDTKTMLFLDKLEKLTILDEKGKREYRKSNPKESRESDNVVITTYINDKKTEPSDEWKVAIDKGKIVVIDKEKTEEKNYSVAIAFKPDMSLKSDFLYSFFRTKTEFPFPALVNGTFDLDAERNHLSDTPWNKKVLEKVCFLLIKTAVNISENDVNYTPLKLLALQNNFPRELSWTGIDDFYFDAVAKSNVFPTVNRKYISFNQDTKFYKSKISKFIVGDSFENLLIYNDVPDIDNFIKKLAKRTNTDLKYKYDYIVPAINALLPGKTIKDRVALCLEFIEEYDSDIKTNKYFPKFFLDSLGNEIDSNQDVFLPPTPASDTSSDDFPQPPEFANLVYMHKKLLSEFRDMLGVNSTLRDLSQKLSLFNVQEYNLTEIIRSTVSKINDKKLAENEKVVHCVDLIKWLWEIFNTTSLLERVALESAEFKIPMITRNGKIKHTDFLYYGREYDNDITDNLFLDRDDLFVASPEMFGLHDEVKQKFCEFLEKIGIKKFPRISKVTFSPSSEYKEQLVSDFSYPLEAGTDTIIKNKSETRTTWFQVNVAMIENYESILKNTRTQHIIEWLNIDSEARTLVTSRFEMYPYSSCSLTQGGQYNQRRVSNNKISCFMWFEFSRIPWIQIDGERYAPIQCLLRGKIKKRLLPYLIEPDFEIYIKNQSKRLTEINEIKLLFEKTGAPESFGDLSTNSLYGTLLLLPDIDEKGEISKSLYSSVIDKKGSIDIDENNENYKKFMNEGKVYCKNTKRYELIRNVKYLTGKTISDAVIKTLCYNLIDIPSRQSQENIEKYFGVKKLDLSGKIVDEPLKHKLNSEFESDFDEYKNYAFCYRVENAGESERTSIKTLKVIICEKITANYDSQKIPLENYAFIRGDNEIVFAKIPTEIATMETARADMDFCAAMAEIIVSTMDIHDEALFSHLRNLYGLQESSRQKLIQQDFDDLRILDEVRSLLGKTKTRRDLFISTCEQIAGLDKLPEIQELVEKIDCENINNFSNVENLLIVMDILDVDIYEFNGKSEFDIDIRPFYKNEFQRLTEEYKQTYKNKLFALLIDKDLEGQKKFLEHCDTYDNYRYSPENSKKYDAKTNFFSQWPILSEKAEEDADDHWKRNRKEFLNGKDLDTLNDLLSERANDSLMYFGKFEFLSDLYNAKVEERKKQEAIEGQIREAQVIPTVPIGTIFNTSAPDIGYPFLDGTRRNGSRSAGMRRERDKTLWGARAEEIVYENFNKSDDYAEVNWVSENAKKKGVNPDGIGGRGYDLTYKDHDGKTIFVEIKSNVEGSITFMMTPNELKVAEENQDRYLIALVTNIQDNDKMKINLLPNLFVYKDGENRSKNSKFTLLEGDATIYCGQE